MLLVPQGLWYPANATLLPGQISGSCSYARSSLWSRSLADYEWVGGFSWATSDIRWAVDLVISNELGGPAVYFLVHFEGVWGCLATRRASIPWNLNSCGRETGWRFYQNPHTIQGQEQSIRRGSTCSFQRDHIPTRGWESTLVELKNGTVEMMRNMKRI